MTRRKFILALGGEAAALPGAARVLATLQPFTPRALIAGVSTRASAEGGKSLPEPGSAQPNHSAQSVKPPTS
jgi:hypothetical protein